MLYHASDVEIQMPTCNYSTSILSSGYIYQCCVGRYFPLNGVVKEKTWWRDLAGRQSEMSLGRTSHIAQKG